MGVWGSGLYSGDFALDLRSTISAVSHLPYEPDRLVEIIAQTEPGAAENPRDEDHTTFWLVLADQFAKRGIVCQTLQQKALSLIEAGADLEMLEKLGMKAAGLGKRRKMIEDLRARILATESRSRTVLKKPQPMVMDTGDVVVYPTCGGRCINPYFASKELDKFKGSPWAQDGWAALVVADCGRAFDYLSWYRPLVLGAVMSGKPTVESLSQDVMWMVENPGTCSPNHFRKMEMEKIGILPVDGEKLRRLVPGLRPGISAAVGDISIANRLNSARQPEALARLGENRKGRTFHFTGIGQILGD